jgi:hypothetical protein
MYSDIDLSRRLYFLGLFGYWEPYFPEEDETDEDSDDESSEDNTVTECRELPEDDVYDDYPKPLVYLGIPLFRIF